MVDIVELRKDEDYLLHLAAIVESSDDAIISKSMDGTIKSWNMGCEKMFGFRTKYAIGKNIEIIIPNEYINEEKKIMERIGCGETIDHYETVRMRENGEHLYVSITVSPLKDRYGKIIGISKIARDMTSRKNFERAIILANNELKYQNREKERRASELVIANKELLYQNGEKEKRAAELIVANIEMAFQNEEKEKRANELVIANKELKFQNLEKERRASELVVANKQLLYENGEKEKRAAELILANLEMAFQNEEKEKRANELVIANKELEQLTYIASHDLQEPLRTISNYMLVLEEDYFDQLDSNARSYIRSVSSAANRMSILVRALLDFSRLGRGRKLTHVDCNKIINAVIEDLQTLIKNTNAVIEVAEMPTLNLYEIEIGQLFQNLIINAIKFQEAGKRPHISIRCQKVNEKWQFSVSDNGIGIEPVHFERIFDIFQRLHAGDGYQGNGIGLANCKKIVELHHGDIWIESSLGKGSSFHFTIPNLSL